jgi:predicted short-subunit dehydrogenase-like oxidoreductase (DUF2520 family)
METTHRVSVVGATGRVGGAFASRLAEREMLASVDEADIVLLCVPDRSIAGAAAEVHEGPYVAHVSGATPLTALAPHLRRFSLHPLQTFTRDRGPEQLDGAYATVTAETDDALELSLWLARTLGLRPMPLADEQRVLYHAGAVMASNFLVTLYRAAASLVTTAGVEAEALTPLMRRVIENNFALTGPIERGDWATVDAHLDALERTAPKLVPTYTALAELTAAHQGRSRGHDAAEVSG